MARIIGGIGSSHVPTIGVAYDKGRQQDPAWAPLFEGYKPVAAWLAEQRADVLVFFYNDHCSSFFFDLYPTGTYVFDIRTSQRTLKSMRGQSVDDFMQTRRVPGMR